MAITPTTRSISSRPTSPVPQTDGVNKDEVIVQRPSAFAFLGLGGTTRSVEVAQAIPCTVGPDGSVVSDKLTYTYFGAVENVLSRYPRLLVEAAYYISAFVGGILEKTPTEFSGQMGICKNVLYATELYRGGSRMFSVCYDAATKYSATAISTAVQAVGQGFNAITHTAEMAVLCGAPIKATVLLGFQRINAGVTLLWSGLGAVEHFQANLKADTVDKKTLSLLKLAMNISFVASAVISLSSIAMGMPLFSGTSMAFMALGALLALAAAVHEAVKDPYQTNMQTMLHSDQGLLFA